jgi:hypothetical protein
VEVVIVSSPFGDVILSLTKWDTCPSHFAHFPYCFDARDEHPASADASNLHPVTVSPP